MAFSAQRWDVDDALVPRPTMLFFYHANRAGDDQWAARQIDDVVGIHGCACFKPKERWVFISDPGEVYVLGQGDDGYENPISPTKRRYFSSIKCISGGYAYAAGLQREVFKRLDGDRWIQLTDTLIWPEKKEPTDNVGFWDVDGFSDTDIYACGGRGDLWAFDGKRWTKEDLPIDSNLDKICCARDGNVYIITNNHELVIGTRSLWHVLEQDVSDHTFEDIIDFGSRILVSTDENIYEVQGDRLKRTNLSPPKMDSYAHMAAGEGVLVVAGAHEAFMYTAGKWKRIV